MRQEKHLTAQWDDMEYPMGIQKTIFVGDKPNNPGDYCKGFYLSWGLSVTEFARDKGKLKMSTKGGRKLLPPAPMFQMLELRYCCWK